MHGYYTHIGGGVEGHEMKVTPSDDSIPTTDLQEIPARADVRAMTIEELIKEHIETELLWEKKIDLELDSNLAHIVDSAGILSLAIWIEGAFDFPVEIDKLAADDFASIRRLATWIRSNAPDGTIAPGGRTPS